ncbi:hypothetical protein [Microvirga sp. VF16]|uniref:hypothetical protein n=1 Tax=Microvirga sp. VF16 TaxID=2807101 RepID=UPI00193D6494|nr:hypothetical protein [Microvirga sp. VF16]QRM28351.1 hypothetical protein JO965_19230 [Microvirga sp. VF16]
MDEGLSEARHIRGSKLAEEIEVLNLYAMADRLGIDLRGLYSSIPHPTGHDGLTVLCVFGTQGDMEKFQSAVACKGQNSSR